MAKTESSKRDGETELYERQGIVSETENCRRGKELWKKSENWGRNKELREKPENCGGEYELWEKLENCDSN